MNKMKRIFSLVLAFSMVLGTFGAVIPAFAEEAVEEAVEKVETTTTTEEVTTEEALKVVPKDVIGTEHEEAVRRLVAFGIVGGYPDGTYKPENAVNRAHFSKMIVEALGLADAVPAAEGQTTGFKDVKANHWAAGYINVASGNGLLKGFPDGTYRPAAQVTYAQALTMLVRALGYQDDFLQGTWPGNYVSKAADVGITAGVKIPSNAQEGAKRGYIAELVNNALDAKVVKVDTYKPNSGAIEYYETDITLLKDKLDISKYEDTRIIEDKLTNDGLAKDEVTVRFLEDTDRRYKNDRYSRGEIVKKDFNKGAEETFRFENTINPREIIGEEVTTYINDNDRVIYAERENDDKAHFDYVEKIKNDKLSLVAFDKEYEFEYGKKDDEKDAVVYNFNDKDDRFDRETNIEELNEVKNLKQFVGRMGKFVVKNNKIVYAEILDPAETPGYMVVMKNDNGLLEGINDESNDFKKDLRDDKDYDKTLVFNTKGEKLSLKDIKEGNVIYVQEQKYDGDDVAYVTVVQDNKVEGEMGKVKEDRVEIAGKTTKVVMNTPLDDDNKAADKVYVTSYAVRGLDEVRRWSADSAWEDDMEDAYKENIVAYTDGVGRIAFLTTEGGNSGYKFGIVTRTYADGDRVRIFTTIDGEEGKDQIFKADKEIDITEPFELNPEGKETKTRGELRVGNAVKFRLNSNGEIAKDKLFVMPTGNMKAMTDDFGKDIIRAVEATDFDTVAKKENLKHENTFAVNSDSVVVIDAPGVGTTLPAGKTNLDGISTGVTTKDGREIKVDIDDFDVTTWKDIKEDKFDGDVRFYVFPKNDKPSEVDGLVFIGRDGANTGSDEEAVYVIDRWKKGDKLFVEYVKYPENKKETREVDQEDRLTDAERDIEKEKAYVGKEKSNGKIALTRRDGNTKDFFVVLGKEITKVKSNYITVAGEEYLTSGSLVYDEDKSKTSSFLKVGDKVDIISDGVRARVVGLTDRKSEDKGIVTLINKYNIAIDDNDSVKIDKDTRLIVDGRTVARGESIVDYIVEGTSNNIMDAMVKIKDNDITLILLPSKVAEAKNIVADINSMSLSTPPTVDQAKAVKKLREDYKKLNKDQQSLVDNLNKLEELEADVEGILEEDEAIKAVKKAANSGSKTEFITALKNSAFADSYKAANDNAYWAGKSGFTAVSKVEDVIAALDNINNEEATELAIKAVVEAVSENDPAKLATALASTAFDQTKVVAANMDAYLAHADFGALDSTSRVSDVEAALETVNNEVAAAVLQELNTAKTAIEGATYTLTIANHNTEAEAKTAVEGVVNGLAEVTGKAFTVTVTTGTHTPATAGTTDGSYTFTVELAKDGQTVTTSTVTAVIPK